MDFDQIMQTVTTIAARFPVPEQHLAVRNSDASPANA
jgi:hypothetical protein